MRVPMLAAVALAAHGLLPGQSFTDVTQSSGIALPPDTLLFGTGMCAADFDGDGDVDLVIPERAGGPIRYYRNDGNMTFTDRSSTAALGAVGPTHVLNAADIDNDGDQDLFVGAFRTPAKLFINDGTGVFSEQGALRGVDAATSVFAATFGDYDRDGWLDLYVANRLDVPCTTNGCQGPNILYRNLGNGFFADVTAATGSAGDDLTFAATFLDYDSDGWPDIATANDKGTIANPNTLLRNNGGTSFTDVAAAVGTNQAIDGMGIDYADVFNDGGRDIICSDLKPDHLFLVQDPTTGHYTESQALYGLSANEIGWAVNFADFDNDGWQDLFIVHMAGPNHLYINPAQPASAFAPWTQVATGLLAHPPGVPAKDQFTACLADFDDDGDIDVLQRYYQLPSASFSLLRNDTVSGGTGPHWLKLRLEGTVGNRDGQGATVAVRTGSLTRRQYRRSGTGFVSASDPRLHFGLGSHTVVDEITIDWPSGQRQRLFDITADRILTVREPSFRLDGTPSHGATVPLVLDAPADQGCVFAVLLAFDDTPRTVLPDGTELPLEVDALTRFALSANNGLLTDAHGIVPASGVCVSDFAIPPIPALAGIDVLATAVTFDAANFPAVRTAFPEAVRVTIQ